MKTPIIIAVVSVSFMFIVKVIAAATTFMAGQATIIKTLLPVIISLLILIGIVKGYRLAWQWGRIIGLIWAIIMAIIAYSVFAEIPENPEMLFFAILITFQEILLLSMFFALGTNAAKEHFHIICPDCGKSKVKGGNFLFTKVICRECNATWS